MAKNAVADWDTTAANNTDIASIDITGATGRVKDGDNAMRAIMAQIKAGVPYLGSGGTFVATATNATGFQITYSDNGATIGPSFQTFRESSSPAAADVIGSYDAAGRSSTGAAITYSRIVTNITDPTNGTGDGAIFIQALLAGTLTNYLAFGVDGAGVLTAGNIFVTNGWFQFPSVAIPSTNTNTLDDYRESTSYTANIASSSGTFTSVSLSNTRVVKVGKLTTVSGRVVCTTLGTASGTITLSSGTWPQGGGTVVVGVCNNSSTGTIGICRMEASGTDIGLYLSGFAMPFTGNGQNLEFAVTYTANS